jgi:hypothetical protein
MATLRRVTSCLAFLSVVFLGLALLVLRASGQVPPTAAQIKAFPECSLSKTNENCKLVIDRGNAVAAPAVQMYSDQTLTIVVKNPWFFERYFLDYQTGQATLSPDVASSIVQGFLPALAKAQFHAAARLADPCGAALAATPVAKSMAQIVAPFQDCLSLLAGQATDIYRRLEPFVAPDSLTPVSVKLERPADIEASISAFEKSEIALSAKITSISNDPNLKNSVPDGPAILQLTNLQKLADAVANDLLGYSQRLAELPAAAGLVKNGFQDCANVIDVTDKEKKDQIQCVAITSRQDSDRLYQRMVTRTITYSLNTLNLVSNFQEAAPDPTKKKLLATVAINFADSPKQSVRSAFRWEASAGAFFSSLPVRSFSAAPVFTKNVITDKTISQNVLHPTVVPFAAGNYRLTNDLPGRWKSNLYWTGAVGINPNTVTADFATGLSLSWRALMLSGLCHFGHDLRLTQGLTVGESLGAGFNGSIPTQTYWTESFAIGLSIRVPSLAGR